MSPSRSFITREPHIAPVAMLGYGAAFLLYLAAFITVMALTMSHHPALSGDGDRPSTATTVGLSSAVAEPRSRAAGDNTVDAAPYRTSRGEPAHR